MSWFSDGHFQPNKYNGIDNFSAKEMAAALYMRGTAIRYFYDVHLRKDWTYWDLFCLDPDEKIELFSEAKRNNPGINFQQLLDQPLTNQGLSFRVTPNPFTKRDTPTVRTLQVHDIGMASQHLQALTAEQLNKVRHPFDAFLLDEREFNITYHSAVADKEECRVEHMHWYRDQLKTEAFAVINPMRPREEIEKDFSTWLTKTRQDLGIGKAKHILTIDTIRKSIIGNKLLQLIDASLLLGPAFRFIPDEADLALALTVDDPEQKSLGSRRFQADTLGEQLNQALDQDTISRLTQGIFAIHIPAKPRAKPRRKRKNSKRR